MKKKELLDILAAERIHGVLEEVLRESDLYITAQNEHDKACEELEKANSDENQKKIVNDILSTANQCGAAYGAVAYRQRFMVQYWGRVLHPGKNGHLRIL